VVTHQLQVERRTGKVRRPKTDFLPLCHATNTCNVLSSLPPVSANSLALQDQLEVAVALDAPWRGGRSTRITVFKPQLKTFLFTKSFPSL